MLDKRLKQAKAGRAKKKGAVAVSLMWDNKRKLNDLDLHVVPPSGEEIFYLHRRSKCKGVLDVDCRMHHRDPVENVIWQKAPKGEYKVSVKNYSGTHNGAVKFDVGICIHGGETQMFQKTVGGKDGTKVLVKKFKVS
eukprot:TRINITY_DN4024_c0_g1_i3.p1 TRINITY_DN4024_c0_g1~~TRINITY_DN4024_c0_g1_i3.p1  ORF type:complete len:137 (+),score=30.54 TRINITY_DN4024_c0_g1_i3:448-858(+)